MIITLLFFFKKQALKLFLNLNMLYISRQFAFRTSANSKKKKERRKN